MKLQTLALLTLISVPAFGLTRAPVEPKVVKDPDAKAMIQVLENTGVAEQSAIESSFFSVELAECDSTVNPAFQETVFFCRFSIGSGLFVHANGEDSEAFIKLLRKNKATSRPIANGRRWELNNLECSTRFDLIKRKLVSTCTFIQF